MTRTTPPPLVIVTRYPTGMFGISYKGMMFWWFGHGEKAVKEKLAEIPEVPAGEVKWEERYYDGPVSDPESYKTRRYFPKTSPKTPKPEEKP